MEERGRGVVKKCGHVCSYMCNVHTFMYQCQVQVYVPGSSKLYSFSLNYNRDVLFRIRDGFVILIIDWQSVGII
jgi:hypothetical protein